MANTVGFNITVANLPDSPTYSSLQEMLDAFGDALSINLDEEYGLFKVGSAAPDALTQVAWLENGSAWKVPDESGNWVYANIDPDFKKVYIQEADPTTTETDVANNDLWLELDSSGTKVEAFKAYLGSSWRTVGFSKDDLDLLQAQVDSVIESTSPYGLKDDVVTFDSLSDAAVNSLTTSILQSVYPIGSLFLSTVSTDPSDLLGFGTWAAYAEGRALVGAGSGTGLTSRALGSEFGDEEVTLTAAQSGVPAHTHDFNIPKSTSFASAGLAADGTAAASGDIFGTDLTTDANAGEAASSAHPNVQPSIAVKVWRRTA